MKLGEAPEGASLLLARGLLSTPCAQRQRVSSPRRDVLALEAGQAAGSDRRGHQSAAVVVEQLGAAERSREGIDRIWDLRVDDHPEPIIELRRVVTFSRATAG